MAAAKQLVAEFDRCARDGDLETFMTYSTEDVVSLAPDQPAIVGKDALREWYRNLYGTFDIEMQHDPLETHVVGSVLIHRGSAHGVLTPKAGGAPMPFDNKYLFVLRRQADGSLRVWRAVFNTNAPPS